MSAQFNDVSWPSLYSPHREVGFTGPPIRPGGHYLSELEDIFKFTLYWTLIFHLPFNFIAGIYAFFNLLFPPARSVRDPILLVPSPAHLSRSHSFSRPHADTHAHSRSHSQSQSVHAAAAAPAHGHPQTQPAAADDWPKLPRLNPRRSRWTFALLVLFAFLVVSLLSAVVGAAVLACVIFGVYRAGGMYVSTWIPFVWAVIQSLVALLEIWPSVIDII